YLFGYLFLTEILHYIGNSLAFDFRIDLTFDNQSNIHLKREFMGTSRTFSIHFWLNLAKKKGDLAPIYAGVTVDGKRAEISLQRQASVTYWDTKSKKSTSRTPEGNALNTYLDQVYAKLLECHKQLSADFELVTAKSIKARFVGQDERHKTLLDLVTYHNQNMKGVLKPGTLKNYYTTENYIRKFLVQKKKTNDIFLKHLKYS